MDQAWHKAGDHKRSTGPTLGAESVLLSQERSWSVWTPRLSRDTARSECGRIGSSSRPGNRAALCLRLCTALKPGREQHSLRDSRGRPLQPSFSLHCAGAAWTRAPPPSRDLQRTGPTAGVGRGSGGGGGLGPGYRRPLRTQTHW